MTRESTRELLGLRPPRLMVVGRRGAGKTTLLNALFQTRLQEEIGHVVGKDTPMQWRLMRTLRGEPCWVLEARGLRGEESEVHSIISSIKSRFPDIILFLIEATEVDSGIDRDLAELEELLEYTAKEGREVPLLVVLSKSDEVEPPYIKTQRDREAFPQKWKAKRQRIEEAVAVAREHAQRYPLVRAFLQGIIPVAAYVRVRADGTIDPDPEFDHRWNLELLARQIGHLLPFGSRVSFAKMLNLEEELKRYRCGVKIGGFAAGSAVPLVTENLWSQSAMLSAVLVSQSYMEHLFAPSSEGKDMVVEVGLALSAGFTYARIVKMLEQREKGEKTMRFIAALASILVSEMLGRKLRK